MNTKKKVKFVLMIFFIFILQYYFSGESEPISANTNQITSIPKYYKKDKEMGGGLILYSFNNIKDSSGKNEVLYRVYDGNNLYNADSEGNYEEKNVLSTTDIDSEKPQPLISGDPTTEFVNDVEANIMEKDSTVQANLLGQYLFNYAGSFNGYGADSVNTFGGFIYDGLEGLEVPLLDEAYGNSTSLIGRNKKSTFNLSSGNLEEIKGNASKSVLTPSKNSDGVDLKPENIKHAYLIMEASVDTPADEDYLPDDTIKNELQNIINRPMTLVGPKQNMINSNGYIPSNFMATGKNTILEHNKPTILYALGKNSTTSKKNGRLRASTITDVTKFVQNEGYGTYYGYNIPNKITHTGGAADVAAGWKLIIIEEDSKMPYNRAGILQLGLINTNQANKSSNTNLSLSFNDYTTPLEGQSYGQLLFSSVGSNPKSRQYSISFDAGEKYLENYVLQTHDVSGGNINRDSNSFGQNIMSIDGQRRTDMSSYRTAPKSAKTFFSLDNYKNKTKNEYDNYTDGMDIELLNVSNKDIRDAFEKDSQMKHNAYIASGSSKINLSIPPANDGDNFITTLGIMSQVEMPTFSTSITHSSTEADDKTNPIGVEEMIEIKATTANMTDKTASFKGVTGTQVEIDLDPSLKVSWDTLNLEFLIDEQKQGTFVSVDSQEELDEKNSNTYYIDRKNNKLIINFGVDSNFLDENNEKVPVHLYNQKGYKLNMTVNARTDTNPTKDVKNTIKTFAKDIISKKDVIVPSAKSVQYAIATDEFDTHSRHIYLHVRQIVIESNENMVVPTNGYGTVSCSKSDDNSNDIVLFKANMETNSSTDEKIGFSSNIILYPVNTTKISYHPIIPQHHQLVGYAVSDTSTEVHSINKIVDEVNITPTSEKHYWVTNYISPVTEYPSFYHWNYKKNDLGSITIPSIE